MSLNIQQPVTKALVAKRVKDWKQRVEDLYKDVQTWLKDKPEYKVSLAGSVQMNEELMAKYGVAPENIRTADLYKGDRLIASFKPIGLWVLGANGRIDLLTSEGSYTIVDNADQFEAAQWHVYPPKDHRKGRKFSKSALLDIA